MLWSWVDGVCDMGSVKNVLVMECSGECTWTEGLAWECGKYVFGAGVVEVVDVVHGGVGWGGLATSVPLFYTTFCLGPL